VPRRALILGIAGQDGSYLARFLIGRGYEVHGTSRDAQVARFEGLAALGIRDKVRLSSTCSAGGPKSDLPRSSPGWCGPSAKGRGAVS
jgi:nucleoside-diphosphate-sugar epimerase